MAALGPRSFTLLVIRGFRATRALPLCPDTLFLQECRSLYGEFHGPACGHDGPYTPDVFFWCCILFFCTFILSSLLKKFKTSRYFPTRVSRGWCQQRLHTHFPEGAFTTPWSSQETGTLQAKFSPA